MKKILKTTLLFLLAFLLLSCGKQNNTINVADDGNVVALRNVYISEINGTASVTHSAGEKIDAYEGMSLNDGDDVVVSSGSTITLDIDSDKHLFADENSHFSVSVEGSEGNTKTIIHLIEGSVLCDINEKLKENEIFNVQTNSSTLSVRGTVFRVCMMQGKDNDVFNLVEVYDGKVLSNLENSEDSLSLEPGQCALIRENSNDESKAPSFVLAEEINDEFIKETGLNISLEQSEDGENGTFKVSLNNASAETLSRLVTIIDEGTQLVVEKEEIQEVKEKIETKIEEPVYTQAIEEEKIEEKKEEEKVEKVEKVESSTTNNVAPVCNHYNYQKEVEDDGSCIREGRIREICQDCGHITYVGIGLNPYNHENYTILKDDVSCTSRYRSEYKHCNDCSKDFDEIFAEPGHIDEDGNLICDRCKADISN